MKTERRLRVALVTNRFLPQVGGAEINIDHQARHLAREVDLTVFCPKRVDGPAEEVRDGFRIVRLRDWLNPGNHFPNPRANTLCPSLFRHILTGNFDLIHCFPALNRNNMLAMLAARLRRTGIVFCFFDYLDYAAIIRATGRVDPDVLAGHVPNRKSRMFLSWMDRIFAISFREIAFLRRYNPRVEYSPVPVLPEEFLRPAPSPRARYGIGEGEFVFLCLNRISAIKGQDIALEAFLRTADRLPGCRMVFVGNTTAEPDLTARMQAQVAASGLGDRVHFTGLVEREELLGWLQHADIQVVPARFMNSGAVVVESWISGTPVIQSDAVDPNLVEEEKNGYVFRAGDLDELGEKMIRALAARDRLPALAAAGKALVLQKYTYDYLTDLYLKAYTAIREGQP
jgi:glycosyltransferase involved in cell wall biosynthesis